MSGREVHWHAATISRRERWGALGLSGATLWLTGLSGSGKSTIAAGVESALVRRGILAYRLDGDNLRSGLNADLGFDDAARRENVRRLAEVAWLFADAGAVAIVGAISPFRADRERARVLHRDGREGPLPFLEVHVDAPLPTCEARDPKGLYRKARSGEISGFTGIDSPYEAPGAPELRLDTSQLEPAACVDRCIAALLAATGRS